MSFCSKCKEPPPASTKLHACDLCSNKICRECSEITSTEARAIELANKRTITFYCHDCKKNIKKLPEFIKMINKLQIEVASIKEQLEDITKNQKSEETEEQEKQQIKNLEERLNKVELAEANNIEAHIDDKTIRPPTVTVEPMLEEIKEREKRTRNVIIFGLAEATADNPDNRNEEDLTKVKEIIKKVTKNIPIEKLKIHRLGKYHSNKLRPIRVVLQNQKEAIEILKNKSVLNGTIYIKCDQTPMQREYLKNVIKLYDERKQNGEDNIKIKYIAGIPKIIKLHNNEAPKK